MGLGLGNAISVFLFHYVKHQFSLQALLLLKRYSIGWEGEKEDISLSLHIKLSDLAWLMLR